MNLTRFDGENGIELVIDVSTGQSFATVSGYARMANLDRTAISKRLTRDNIARETAEIQTTTGLKSVTLIPGKFALKWLAQDNVDLFEAMAECGWTVYCHRLAGYRVSSIPAQEKPLAFLGEPVERSPKEIKEDCEIIDQILGNVSFADSAETARFKLMASCYPLSDLVRYIDFALLKKMWSLSPGALADQLKMDLPQARMILFHVCYGMLKDEFPESLSTLMDWINSSSGAQLPFIADEIKFLGKSKK